MWQFLWHIRPRCHISLLDRQASGRGLDSRATGPCGDDCRSHSRAITRKKPRADAYEDSIGFEPASSVYLETWSSGKWRIRYVRVVFPGSCIGASRAVRHLTFKKLSRVKSCFNSSSIDTIFRRALQQEWCPRAESLFSICTERATLPCRFEVDRVGISNLTTLALGCQGRLTGLLPCTFIHQA